MRHGLLSLLTFVSVGCASHDEPRGREYVFHPSPEPRATIASVQLVEDCPDPDAGTTSNPAAARPPVEERAKRASRGDDDDGTSLRPPCTQSTMQLSLAHEGAAPLSVEVRTIRLMRGTQVLGTIAARKPSKWSDSGVYDPWDERVPVGSAITVSYRLAEPDWTKVQDTLGVGVDVYAQRYELEVDLTVGPENLTVRSPEFSREYPHVVET
jgi:hypothetical protein